MSGAAQFGGPQFGQVQFAQGAAVGAAPGAQGRSGYFMEVCDDDHVTIYRLPFFLRDTGRWKEVVNGPSDISFSYPLTDPVDPAFAYPNTLALYDNDGTLLDRFLITGRGKSTTKDHQLVRTVRGQGVLSQLAREYVASYETPKLTTVSTIVGHLLAFQANSKFRPIVLGTIDGSIGLRAREIKVQNTYILAALRELQRQVGGYLSVDSSHRLNWTATLQTNVGQEIRATKNMVDMSVDEDFTTIQTRLYGKGAGTDDTNRLTSVQNSDNQGTYGQLSGNYTDQTIREQSHLNLRTANRVDVLKVPQKTVKVGVIDLSKSDTVLDYSHEAINIGARVRVINVDLDEVIETNIVEITRSLDMPQQVQIQVADPNAGGTLYPAGGSPFLPMGSKFVDRIADIIQRVTEMSDQDTGVFDALGIEIGADVQNLTNMQFPKRADMIPLSSYSSGRLGASVYRYRIDTGPWSDETSDTEFTPDDALAAGAHTVDVQERDNAGNWSDSGSLEITIDAVSPNPPVFIETVTPDGTTVTEDVALERVAVVSGDAQPTLKWQSGGGGGDGTFRTNFDDAGFGAGSSATTFTPPSALDDASTHTLEVQEEDGSSNWSASSTLTFTIDLTAPDAPQVDGDTPTQDTTPTWSWKSGSATAAALTDAGGTGTLEPQIEELASLESGDASSIGILSPANKTALDLLSPSSGTPKLARTDDDGAYYGFTESDGWLGFGKWRDSTGP